MKRIALVVVGVLVLGAAAFAQSDAEFVSWMKDVSATNRSLRSNLEAQNGTTAAADANKLAEIFGKVHDFFESKNSASAAKIAMDAQNGYKSVSEHAGAGHIDQATQASDSARSNCGTCHDAHREKGPDDAWIIKY